MAAPTQNHDLLLFFFSLSFFPCSLLSSSPRCPVPKSDCGLSDPTIHFPFRLHPFQPSSCGFPDQGFNLTCSGPNNLTLLHLPKSGSGPFSIQDIDYVTQEILLNDPNNCLPRRLLSLDLSGSPFSPVHHQEFSLYNCSSKSVDYKYLTPITCLSGSGYRVFAVDVDLGRTMFGSSCNQIEVVRVPVRAKFIEESSSDLSEDIRLKWSDPDCKHCYRAGGWCGLKSGSSVEIDCFAHPRSRVHGVTIGIGVAALICLLGTICCVLMKFGCRTSITRRAEAGLEAAVNGGTQSPSAAAIAVPVGIDQPTIESFPKVVLGESRRVPRGEEITCAICLGDYQPKETLRTLPECTHSFHVECIDEWLRSHGTCPVCRNSLPHNVV